MAEAKHSGTSADSQVSRGNLLEHIQDQQDTACILSGVIEAAILVAAETGAADPLAALLRAAHRLAAEIDRQLDVVNLPEGGAA